MATTKKIANGRGKFPIRLPLPMPVKNSSFTPRMVAPLVTYLTTERRKTWVASVTINGGSLAFAMIAPLTKPVRAPNTQVIRTQSAKGRPICPCRITKMTPQAAKLEPIERSMPPAMITNVMPKAIMPTAEQFRKIAMKLFHLKKVGAIMPQSEISMTKTTETL